MDPWTLVTTCTCKDVSITSNCAVHPLYIDYHRLYGFPSGYLNYLQPGSRTIPVYNRLLRYVYLKHFYTLPLPLPHILVIFRGGSQISLRGSTSQVHRSATRSFLSCSAIYYYSTCARQPAVLRGAPPPQPCLDLPLIMS